MFTTSAAKYIAKPLTTSHYNICIWDMQGQVAPLDLSGVDLSAASGDRLKRDRRWTFILMIKLSIPLFVAIVRVFVHHTRGIDLPPEGVPSYSRRCTFSSLCLLMHAHTAFEPAGVLLFAEPPSHQHVLRGTCTAHGVFLEIALRTYFGVTWCDPPCNLVPFSRAEAISKLYSSPSLGPQLRGVP